MAPEFQKRSGLLVAGCFALAVGSSGTAFVCALADETLEIRHIVPFGTLLIFLWGCELLIRGLLSPSIRRRWERAQGTFVAASVLITSALVLARRIGRFEPAFVPQAALVQPSGWVFWGALSLFVLAALSLARMLRPAAEQDSPKRF
ncbi:MAG: hypothetical protein AAF411_02835 [Myxococcota bacterium]